MARSDITLERHVLQKVFDAAVNSMDFTSGCLDDEEVEALRATAVLLGVDPITATPDNFKCKYIGHCTPSKWRSTWNNKLSCMYCRKTLEGA